MEPIQTGDASDYAGNEQNFLMHCIRTMHDRAGGYNANSAPPFDPDGRLKGLDDYRVSSRWHAARNRVVFDLFPTVPAVDIFS